MTMCWCCKWPLNSRQTLCRSVRTQHSDLGEKTQFTHLLVSWCYWDRKNHKTETINKTQTKVKIFTRNTVQLVYFYLWIERVADSLGLLGVICSFLLSRGFPRAAGMEKHLLADGQDTRTQSLPILQSWDVPALPTQNPGIQNSCATCQLVIWTQQFE